MRATASSSGILTATAGRASELGTREPYVRIERIADVNVRFPISNTLTEGCKEIFVVQSALATSKVSLNIAPAEVILGRFCIAMVKAINR